MIKQYSIRKLAYIFAAVMCVFLFVIQASFSQTLLRQTNPWLTRPVAILQGLDKITARVSTFEIVVNDVGHFGTLNIMVKSCRKRPPTETPESAAFVEIADEKPSEQAIELFKGWMFASSPALSSLEHPVYDVWLLGCKKLAIR